MSEPPAPAPLSGETRTEIETLRKENERLVAEVAFERQRVFSLLRQAPAFMAVVRGKDHVFAFTNDAYDELTGRPDVVGKPVHEAIPEVRDQGFITLLDRVFETGIAYRSGVVPAMLSRRSDVLPERRYVDFAYQPLTEADGTITGVFVHGVDMTDATVAEQQLRQSQKMEAVGRLAGGVAHDFNNMLSVIVSYAELAMDALDESHPARADVREIQLAGQRAGELTRQLLALSRKQVLQPRVLDLAHVVENMRSMLGRLLGENIALTIVPSANLGRALADPGQIEQVVTNLAVNARDAMQKGGKLTIEVANVELEAADLGASTQPVTGSFVMIAMSDTGQGMDPITCANIFEPFFTTKGKSKGTGLGLATVHGILQQSQGHVCVYSEPGVGSTFKVYLPRTDAAAVVASDSAPTGSETILLVEDEDQVRAVAGAVLRRAGYRVIEMSSGAAACAAAAAFAEPIHLLVTDVVMPGMNGRQVAHELLSQRPQLKVLYASGYTNDAVVRHGVLEANVSFLQKPFTTHALLGKVRDVLDQE